MPTDPLVAIQAELAQIKWVLIVLGAAVAIVAVFAMVRAYLRVSSGMKSFLDERFTREANDLLERNKLKEVRALAELTLAERPNHSNARWYLARAYHLERDYDAALREFSVLRETTPTWRADHIDPYIQEIERSKGVGTRESRDR